ncbi:MAG: signal peptide peptidase SppA, partial [Desulfatiglandales bacterium]
ALVLNRTGVNVGKLRLTAKEKVGVLTLEGAIMDSRQIIEELSEMVRDKSVKAIVLRVDSPGGSVGPSQEIYKEVLRAREKKPVVVSMGGLAASGGYYVASAASKIVASPGTVTGSIGVITQFVNLEGLMSKIGVQLEVVKMGEYKDMGSPHRALTEKEREMISTLIQDIHQQF